MVKIRSATILSAATQPAATQPAATQPAATQPEKPMPEILFGPYRFDPRTTLLHRGDEEVVLPPRAAAVLAHLLEHADEIVTKGELLDAVWGDAHVGESSLKEAIHVLRQALGEQARRAVYIRTISRRGYRFIAPIRHEVSAPEQPVAVPARRVPSTAIVFCVVLLASAATALIGYRVGREPVEPPPQPYRFEVELPPGQILGPGPANLALTPDGRNLIYAAKTAGSAWQLYLRPTGELAPRPIPGSEGGRAPFLSPDGKTVAFFTSHELRTVALGGGPARTICEVEQGLGGTWSDGRLIFSTFESRDAVGLWWVPTTGGRPRVFTTRGPGEAAHRRPTALGDGKILYTIWRSRFDDSEVALFDPATGRSRTLVEGGAAAEALPGFLLYARPGELLAAVFNGEDVIGSPRTILREMATTPVWGTAHFTVSASGDLVYMPPWTPPPHRLLWVDKQGSEPFAELERTVMDLRLSPDGHRLLLTTQGASLDLWTLELGHGALARLTDDGTSLAGVFSAEGEEIFYTSRQDGRPGIYARPVTGGSSRRIYPSDTAALPCDVTDNEILIAAHAEETGWDLHLLDPLTQAVRPFLVTPFHEKRARLSPDGRFVAYESDETGASEIHLRRFPEGEARWVVTSGGGTHAMFSADGKEIYFRHGRRVSAAPIDLRGPEPSIGPAVERWATPDIAGYSLAFTEEGAVVLEESGTSASGRLVYTVHLATELATIFEAPNTLDPAW